LAQRKSKSKSEVTQYLHFENSALFVPEVLHVHAHTHSKKPSTTVGWASAQFVYLSGLCNSAPTIKTDFYKQDL